MEKEKQVKSLQKVKEKAKVITKKLEQLRNETALICLEKERQVNILEILKKETLLSSMEKEKQVYYLKKVRDDLGERQKQIEEAMETEAGLTKHLANLVEEVEKRRLHYEHETQVAEKEQRYQSIKFANGQEDLEKRKMEASEEMEKQRTAVKYLEEKVEQLNQQIIQQKVHVEQLEEQIAQQGELVQKHVTKFTESKKAEYKQKVQSLAEEREKVGKEKKIIEEEIKGQTDAKVEAVRTLAVLTKEVLLKKEKARQIIQNQTWLQKESQFFLSLNKITR